jgi:hypothetical protein
MKKKLFTEDVSFFLKQLGDLGWSILLVGGSVRDLSLGRENIHDYDFEVRGGSSGKLLIDLKRVFRDVEICDFGVFKAHIEYGQLEFALPRIETYEGAGPFSHSDFTALVDAELPILESFKRRDFKFNAMAMSVEEGEVAEFFDPFQGMVDLKNKEIDFCDEDNFFKDPVRLLRAIRFSLQMDMHFSKRLNENIKLFNLTKLTPHHLFQSAFKINPVIFFKEFWKVIEIHNIPVADFVFETKIMTELEWHEQLGFDKETVAIHLAHKFFNDDEVIEIDAHNLILTMGYSPSQFVSLVQFFKTVSSLDLKEVKALKQIQISKVSEEHVTNILGCWQKLNRLWISHHSMLRYFILEQNALVLDSVFATYLPIEKTEIHQFVTDFKLAPKEIWKVQLLYRMQKLAL